MSSSTDYEPITSSPSTPSPPSPISTASSRPRRLTYVLISALLTLSLALFFYPSRPFSPVIQGTPALSTSRSQSSSAFSAEVPTGDCSPGLFCRARFVLQYPPTGDPILEVGYLIRSSNSGDPVRPVDKTTMYHVGKVTPEEAHAWAEELFNSLKSHLHHLADPDAVVDDMAAAIMSTKDIAQKCPNTDQDACSPLVKISLVFEPPKPSPCLCPKLWKPVCGTDGKTYANECIAGCKGTKVKCKGGCPCDCHCPKSKDPVCATDGKTYDNACLANCLGAEVKCAGECPCPCFCTREYAPVCGADGKTYSNTCVATCSKVDIECEGRCPCDCDCPKTYWPVCGLDGKTYDNYCLAHCAGVWVDCKGDCPCPKAV